MTRVVVVGDVLLDVDVHGEVTRLCPDAPAPVLDEREVVRRPGGAGLAALLLARDGVDVALAAAVADDEGGAALRELLRDAGVELLALPEDGSTREKVRLRAGGTSLARWDRGRPGALQVPLDELAVLVRRCDAVLAADYGGAVLRDPRVREVLESRGGGRAPLVWDPHPRGDVPVPGATVATPNLAEALAATGLPAPARGSSPLLVAGRAAEALVARWGCGAAVVTAGSAGAVMATGTGAPLVVPPEVVAEGDPCGAGDRFAGALAAALGAGAVPSEAVAAAVSAAGAFVAAGGASALRPPAAGPEESAASALPAADGAASGWEAVERLVARVRAGGGSVVATGGCFDLLHAGHVQSLRSARGLGDALVVLLNSDASVRRLKGPPRPLQPAAERAEVLGALGCVDAVVVFDEDTPVEALSRLRPDVWTKGGDYSADALPEAGAVAGWGGQVVVLPYLSGRSTTRLVDLASRDDTDGGAPRADERSRT